MTPKIVLHHLEQSRSERLFWLLEELNVPYDVVIHYRAKAGNAEPSLRQVNSLGKAPALELDGKLITESGFIIHALLNHPDIPIPASIETKASDSSTYWNHFAEASLMIFIQPLRMATLRRHALLANKDLSEDEQRGIKAYGKVLTQTFVDGANASYAEAEKFLEGNENFSGSDKFGEGDFNMMFPVSFVGGAPGSPYTMGPKTKAWMTKVRERKTWQKGLKRMMDEEKAGKSKL